MMVHVPLLYGIMYLIPHLKGRDVFSVSTQSAAYSLLNFTAALLSLLRQYSPILQDEWLLTMLQPS